MTTDATHRELLAHAGTFESRVWLAAIIQAIHWSRGQHMPARPGHYSHAQQARLKAKRMEDAAEWLESDDCARVCEMLGLDVDWLRERIAEMEAAA